MKKAGIIISIKIFRAILVLCCALTTMANATMLMSSINQDSLYIGDRIHFNVTMMVPKGAQVTPPATDNGFGKLIVKEWNTNKVEKKNADSLSFNYIITTYSTECCTIPALGYLQNLNNKVDTFYTQPTILRVALVTSSDTGAIQDIKPPETVGSPSLAWLWLLLVVLAVIAIIIIIKKLWKAKSKPAPVIPPKPPYEEAMEALRLLEEKQYIAKGMIREYAFELSDIVKRYIERRFQVTAAEFTTEEMLLWIRIAPLEPKEKKILEWFFNETDPIKFAKLLPDNDTLYRFGSEIKAFLEATKPVFVPGTKETDKNHAA
jgi:hypothetical protein